MKDVAKEERPIVGQMVNDTRAVIEEALEKEMTLLKKKVRENSENMLTAVKAQIENSAVIGIICYKTYAGLIDNVR